MGVEVLFVNLSKLPLDSECSDRGSNPRARDLLRGHPVDLALGREGNRELKSIWELVGGSQSVSVCTPVLPTLQDTLRMNPKNSFKTPLKPL